MTARRKAPQLEAPNTIEEATAMLAEYNALRLKIDETKNNAAQSIAAIEAARDGFTAPMMQRAETLFRQLQVWWAVAGPDLVKKGQRSILLAGCKIGVRLTTPKLRLPKGMKEPAAVEWLQGLALEDAPGMLRTKITLDKQAILASLAGPMTFLRETLGIKGFAPKQSDEFFIDTAHRKPENPELDTGAQETAA